MQVMGAHNKRDWGGHLTEVPVAERQDSST